jgi:hypothetical protein
MRDNFVPLFKAKSSHCTPRSQLAGNNLIGLKESWRASYAVLMVEPNEQDHLVTLPDIFELWITDRAIYFARLEPDFVAPYPDPSMCSPPSGRKVARYSFSESSTCPNPLDFMNERHHLLSPDGLASLSSSASAVSVLSVRRISFLSILAAVVPFRVSRLCPEPESGIQGDEGFVEVAARTSELAISALGLRTIWYVVHNDIMIVVHSLLRSGLNKIPYNLSTALGACHRRRCKQF